MSPESVSFIRKVPKALFFQALLSLSSRERDEERGRRRIPFVRLTKEKTTLLMLYRAYCSSNKRTSSNGPPQKTFWRRKHLSSAFRVQMEWLIDCQADFTTAIASLSVRAIQSAGVIILPECRGKASSSNSLEMNLMDPNRRQVGLTNDLEPGNDWLWRMGGGLALVSTRIIRSHALNVKGPCQLKSRKSSIPDKVA